MSPLRRAGLIACAAVMLLAVVSPVWADVSGSYRDEFRGSGYDGNDGSLDWPDDWHEVPLATDSESGAIQVVTGGCPASNCLRLGPGNMAGQGVYRAVDLSGAGSVTLSFSNRRQVPDGGSTAEAYVAVSIDGWKWTSVSDFAMSQTDPEFTTRSIDLSAWAGSTVRIAFFGTGFFDGELYVDDINVLVSSNLAPVFTAPLLSRHNGEGDQIDFVLAATDPDGGGITFDAAGLPPGLGISPETGAVTGTISYQAAAGSPYSTTVTVTDSAGAVANATFPWVISNGNRPPSLVPVTDVVIDELTPLGIPVAASDPDLPDDSLEFSLVAAPPGATISPSGMLRWTPGEEAGPGEYEVRVRVEDSASPAGWDETSFQIRVAEVNQAPVIDPIADLSLRPGDQVDIVVDVSDRDRPSNKLSFSATGLPAGVAIDGETGEIGGRIAAGADPASGTAVVTVRDNGVPPASGIETFSWQIGTGNRAPILDPIPGPELRRDGRVVFTVRAHDADSGDSLSYWLAAGIDPIPAGASIDALTGEFTWQPEEADYGSTYRINVGVSDDGSPRLSATELITIALPPYNHPPEVAPIPDQEDAEGDVVSLAVVGTDPDPENTLHYSVTGLPAGLDIDPDTGVISGEIGYEAAAMSPYAVEVTVSDDGLPGQSGTGSFEWSVENTNRPPESEQLSIVVLVDVPTAIELPVLDPDGDELEISITEQPIYGALSGEGRNLVYTASGLGRDGFRFAATDGDLATDGAVTIEIRLSNVAPTAGVDEYVVAPGATLDVAAPGVLANDADADGEPLLAVLVAPPDHGILQLDSDGSFSYEPDPGFEGLDKFTYAAVDALGEQASATVVLVVGNAAGVAQPGPVLSDDSAILIVNPAWVPPPTADASFLDRTRQSLGLTVSVPLAMVAHYRFPVLLLAFALALALAFGRVPLFAAGSQTIEGTALVESYDRSHDLARLIAVEGGAEVFVSAAALGANGPPTIGQHVEFVATSIRGRNVAVKAWFAT